MGEKRLYKIFFIIISLMVFTGCIVKNDKSKIENISQYNSSNIQKKQKLCKKHIEVIEYAFFYVIDEFNKGYFLKNDTTGAKAQLFLIENNSKSVFAQNINQAVGSYNRHYKLAKQQKCDLKKFMISPLNRIKIKIKQLEKGSSNTLN